MSLAYLKYLYHPIIIRPRKVLIETKNKEFSSQGTFLAPASPLSDIFFYSNTVQLLLYEYYNERDVFFVFVATPQTYCKFLMLDQLLLRQPVTGLRVGMG